MPPFILTYWKPALAAFVLIGAFIAGVRVEGWRNKAKQARAIEAAIAQAEEARDQSQALAENAALQAELEQTRRREAEARLNDAYAANAALAASRASNTTRIIKRAEGIANDLEDTNPCIREPWPSELWSYAFALDRTAEGLSGPAPGGYTTGE